MCLRFKDDVTRAIMATLKLRLASLDDQPLVKMPTTSAEAYELYLKGRFFLEPARIGLKKAQHYFELALIEDPAYVPAMSGLADAYSLLIGTNTCLRGRRFRKRPLLRSATLQLIRNLPRRTLRSVFPNCVKAVIWPTPSASFVVQSS